ncbi:bile acid:sodium symporter family protein [Glaciecola sp. 2405UD65-10]|uniref:bile acid:sodium symporter family protein n=1 Tax=Glaciecola sp. 2405UD65-10 TaxID=3397244 RepID=UPI003B5CDEBF
MQASLFTSVVLPALLALIMLGMGLSLRVQDFARLASMPKAIFVGLVGQVVLLPLLAFAIAVFFSASPEIAIGLMILAACPGGTTSNLFAHIAKANLALSISLTAITTVICVFTTPFLIAFSIDYFIEGESPAFSLLETSLALMLISLLPVLIGMLIKAKNNTLAERAEPIFRKLSVLFMILIIIKISYDESDSIIAAFPDMFILTIGLNLLATAMGLFLARLFLLSNIDGATLGIEIGTQNATLAILIAISLLGVPAYALVPGVYGIAMYLGATLLVIRFKQKSRKEVKVDSLS